MTTQKLQPGMLIQYECGQPRQDDLIYMLVQRRSSPVTPFDDDWEEEGWEYISPDGVVDFCFFHLKWVHVVETEMKEDLG